MPAPLQGKMGQVERAFTAVDVPTQAGGVCSGMKKHGKREQWKVVLAEDTDEDALLIQLALERASAVPVRVHRARNGDTALLMIEVDV